MRKTEVAIIGGGIAGMSAAALIAKKGYEVTIIEKNNTLGGRLRELKEDGFSFDMGPSWYWMPDIFEKFFNLFGRTTKDYYDLIKLDPSYRVFFNKEKIIDVPDTIDDCCKLFDTIERGSGKRLMKFLEEGRKKYEVGLGKFAYKPSLSILEFCDVGLLKSLWGLRLFESVEKNLKRHFKSQEILKILSFPSLLLGGSPGITPSLYTLMNYADRMLGTWYPKGGMYKIVEAFKSLCEEHRVNSITNTSVKAINPSKNSISLETTEETIEAKLVIANADYHHIESMLSNNYRSYTEKHWQNRIMSPSCLLFYIGINKKLSSITHHNLFFDSSMGIHMQEIYKEPQWPSNPLFYICCPSLTDEKVAPKDHENLFLLIPIASGLTEITETKKKEYLEMCLNRFSSITKEDILSNIVFCKSYSINNFRQDYNSFKGNAYGLASTLFQTSILRPRIQSKKIPNLFFTGHLTVPGPGIPPAIISGQITAELANNYLNNH